MKFSNHVERQLQSYVYRLLDPRNGETFYIGKGSGNRVFSHIKGELAAGTDELSEKLKRIREIRASGFEVGHVIHRHGLDDATAFEVEAALIDAFPEVSNEVGGARSDQRGLMHAQQIIERYEAKEATFRHKVVIISINRSILERKNAYEAVRYAWKIDPSEARRAELVLAVQQGLIIGAFVPTKWVKATTSNFPGTIEDRPGRWGFIGHEAPDVVAKLYLRRRLPDRLRKRGAANPVRYVFEISE